MTTTPTQSDPPTDGARRAEPADRASEHRFRADVDGLRAVAIALVVAYHVELPGFSGGFIGVDVFFVISGWLITRNLLRDSEAGHRVRPLTFWAKRVRRLVPAMATMVVAVMALSLAFASLLQWEDIARAGAAASLYVSNIFFAGQAGDYFAADVTRNPLLHTWSLGVEEQFYLLWPFLFLAVGAATRRTGRHARTATISVLAVVAVCSFALGLHLTAQSSPWAFFGLPARAWEFAAAGLLAALPLRRPGRLAGLAASLVGLGLLAVATVTFSGSTPYPGWRALLPVGGALLLIGAGGTGADGTANAVSRLLAIRPATWLGRLSYSWYLWHWPLIVLLPAVLGRGYSSLRVRVLAAVLALGVAYLALRIVENPIRFSARLAPSWKRTFAVGAAITAVALASAGGLAVARQHRLVGLDGQLAQVHDDIRRDECDSRQRSPSGISYCEAGDVDGETSIMLFGDSHSLMWVEALAEAADAAGVRLIHRSLAGCPAVDVDVDVAAITTESCPEHRQDSLALVAELHPDGVVVAQASHIYAAKITSASGGREPEDEAARRWSAALDDLVLELGELGVEPAVILDNPALPDDPIVCIERERDPEACHVPVGAIASSGVAVRAAEVEVLRRHDVAAFGLTDDICRDDVCQVWRDDVFIYTDRSHLTRTFTLQQVDDLVAFLERIGADRPSG